MLKMIKVWSLRLQLSFLESQLVKADQAYYRSVREWKENGKVQWAETVGSAAERYASLQVKISRLSMKLHQYTRGVA